MTLTMSAAFVLLSFAFGAVPPIEQQTAAQTDARRQPVVNDISGFSVVLLVGETQPSGAGSEQDLPAGARRAIKDMQEFLPFKHFRVLDSQWTSCCSPPRSGTTVVAGRLQGVIALPGSRNDVNLVSRVYGFSIAAGTSAASIPVRFVLSLDDPRAPASSHDAGARGLERERQDVQAEIATLEVQIEEMRRRIAVGTMPALEVRPAEDRLASLRRKLNDLSAELEHASSGGGGSARAIIDSSFTMQAGETVVVGTSRLGGDKALVALVTAVARRSGSERR